MKHNILSLLMVILSIFGTLDASYVTYETLSNKVPMCIPPFDCAKVLHSQWAYIAGVPLSALGVFFYATMLVTSVMLVAEVQIKVPIFKNVRNLLYALAAFGFGFSLYLVFLQQFVIEAWCLWCAISAGTTTSLFIVAMLHKFFTREKTSE